MNSKIIFKTFSTKDMYKELTCLNACKNKFLKGSVVMFQFEEVSQNRILYLKKNHVIIYNFCTFIPFFIIYACKLLK